MQSSQQYCEEQAAKWKDLREQLKKNSNYEENKNNPHFSFLHFALIGLQKKIENRAYREADAINSNKLNQQMAQNGDIKDVEKSIISHETAKTKPEPQSLSKQNEMALKAMKQLKPRTYNSPLFSLTSLNQLNSKTMISQQNINNNNIINTICNDNSNSKASVLSIKSVDSEVSPLKRIIHSANSDNATTTTNQNAISLIQPGDSKLEGTEGYDDNQQMLDRIADSSKRQSNLQQHLKSQEKKKLLEKQQAQKQEGPVIQIKEEGPLKSENQTNAINQQKTYYIKEEIQIKEELVVEINQINGDDHKCNENEKADNIKGNVKDKILNKNVKPDQTHKNKKLQMDAESEEEQEQACGRSNKSTSSIVSASFLTASPVSVASNEKKQNVSGHLIVELKETSPEQKMASDSTFNKKHHYVYLRQLLQYLKDKTDKTKPERTRLDVDQMIKEKYKDLTRKEIELISNEILQSQIELEPCSSALKIAMHNVSPRSRSRSISKHKGQRQHEEQKQKYKQSPFKAVKNNISQIKEKQNKNILRNVQNDKMQQQQFQQKQVDKEKLKNQLISSIEQIIKMSESKLSQMPQEEIDNKLLVGIRNVIQLLEKQCRQYKRRNEVMWQYVVSSKMLAWACTYEVELNQLHVQVQAKIQVDSEQRMGKAIVQFDEAIKTFSQREDFDQLKLDQCYSQISSYISFDYKKGWHKMPTILNCIFKCNLT